jgi:hypothetical protein
MIEPNWPPASTPGHRQYFLYNHYIIIYIRYYRFCIDDMLTSEINDEFYMDNCDLKIYVYITYIHGNTYICVHINICYW